MFVVVGGLLLLSSSLLLKSIVLTKGDVVFSHVFCVVFHHLAKVFLNWLWLSMHVIFGRFCLWFC